MTAAVQPFNLDVLEHGEHITRLMEAHFDARVRSVAKVGQGFYAHIYRVELEGDPGVLILKCHKYTGRSAREQQQLGLLKRHAIVKVPTVYGLHLQSELFPAEALSMEVIPGINASQIEFPDEGTQQQFVDLVVENLLSWHGVSNPQGFGELDGPFYESWRECFGRRIAAYQERIHQDEHRRVVSEYVMGVIDRSVACFDQIFRNGSRQSSLVHSDYNAWNMLVDPATFALTGVIDPLDAGWAEFEIDLFHLTNCRPELGLLERYLREVEVEAGFGVRFKFYRFWDDVKHYLRMGWYEEGRFRAYAEALEAAMEDG